MKVENNIAISVENVNKKYILQHPQKEVEGDETLEFLAVKNISFEIKKGERIGIFGGNGSGKSTLLKILAGVTKPTSGKVTIDGRVASILDIGAGFHPDLSGKENIFLNGQLLGFSTRDINERYNEIVEFSEIGKFIDEPVKNYSNGMYLRLAFSIMLHLDFDIYLLDEVMGVGDAGFQMKVNQFLQEKNKQKKLTFIMVSHDLHELTSFCNYFYLMNNGKIEKHGTSDICENYLNKSFTVFGTHFPLNFAKLDTFEIFKNDFVNIEEVYVSLGEDGILLEDKHIQFNCVVQFKQQADIDIGFGIENVLGEELCYASSFLSHGVSEDKVFKNEHVVISAIIPPFSLKNGTYILNVSIVINGQILLVGLFKLLTFVVNKNPNLTDKLFENRSKSPVLSSNWIFKVID